MTDNFMGHGSAEAAITRLIRVYGIVQGVGFRPTVSRHAASSGVRGTVCNKGPYVEILTQGSAEECDAFLRLLREHPPKRSSILKISSRDLESFPSRFSDFSIIESERTSGEIYISPDIAICEDCRRELFDPHDRRYLHPFINCTNCGPRMTILDKLPYDRERTSMKIFPMCRACSSEYHDPATRRYDAQPVCCNDCGPVFYILDKESGLPDRSLTGSSAITHARKVIASGGIAAVKGIGGFHLCCDATNEEAVKLLRARKHRPSKPFAVMAKDMEVVRRECVVRPGQEEILTGHQKPILLLQKRRGYAPDNPAPSAADAEAPGALAADTDCMPRIAQSAAPGNPKLGVMLPYAPIQLLLFDYNDNLSMPDCLIMTSANDSGAPICRDDCSAVNELGSLCDAILSNNRLIRVRADDTVMDYLDGSPYMVRRSRGYAPLPVMVNDRILSAGDRNCEDEEDPSDTRHLSVIGIGGELKNSFCIGTGSLFYMSPYIGDLSDIRTGAALDETLHRFLDLLEADAGAVCMDMHPLYTSRTYGYELAAEPGTAPRHAAACVKTFELQHHYAHILSCMAENDCADSVIGVSFDGTGYGTDKTIWGGELLICNWDTFSRAGHIAPFMQVGGDISAREGWRIAASMVSAFDDPNDIIERTGLCSPDEYRMITACATRNLNCVVSTSAGRLFDAVSAVLGICRISGYEGEASTRLMYAAYSCLESGEPSVPDYRDGLIRPENGSIVMDTDKLFKYIVEQRLLGRSSDYLAWSFHLILADMITEAVKKASDNNGGIMTAALSGGVFQNTLLAGMVIKQLSGLGFRVLVHHLIPTNDGGLALGQAVYAMRQLNKSHSQQMAQVQL